MAEPIEMPFGMWTAVSPRNRVRCSPYLPVRRGILTGKMGGPLIIDNDRNIYGATAWPVFLKCRLCGLELIPLT